jgi:hypothetical protein
VRRDFRGACAAIDGIPRLERLFTSAAQGQRPAAGLQQGSDEEQAAVTRMSRLAQLQRDMEVAAAASDLP